MIFRHINKHKEINNSLFFTTNRSYTLAYEPPTKEQIIGDVVTFINGGRNSKLSIGIAEVSKKDMYCKKIGREVSSKRFKETPVTISFVKIEVNIVTIEYAVADLILHFEYNNIKNKTKLRYVSNVLI